MSGLTAQISVRVGDLLVEVDLTVAPGETLAVVGPNGAGKTTILRALAGLLPPGAGRVQLDDDVWADPSGATEVPPQDRSVGFLFQDRALFPHLDAVENAAFSGSLRGGDSEAAAIEARSWLSRLGYPAASYHLKPEAMSGGMAQRVALARTLLRPARLLLLDEPLAALDARSRLTIRDTLVEALAGFEGPRLVVTHDVVDAAAFGDRVIVIEDGAVTHQGSLRQVLSDPRTEYVAGLADPGRFSR